MKQYKKEKTLSLASGLPNLPRLHQKKEADFGVTFRHWIEGQMPEGSQSFELKHTRGRDYLPLKEVKPEQIAYGMRIKRTGELIRVQGTRGEPDYIWIKGPAWIVIRYPKAFVIIDVDVFSNEKTASLTFTRACQIATNVV